MQSGIDLRLLVFNWTNYGMFIVRKYACSSFSLGRDL